MKFFISGTCHKYHRCCVYACQTLQDDIVAIRVIFFPVFPSEGGKIQSKIEYWTPIIFDAWIKSAENGFLSKTMHKQTRWYLSPDYITGVDLDST
jgi:hypothetical protein